MTSIKETFIFQKIAKFVISLWFRIEPYQMILLRLAIILGIAVITPVIGILVTKINPIVILIAVTAPLVLVGLQFVLPRPELGPVMILFVAAFIPFSLPTGTESKLVDSFLLTLLFVGNWLLYMALVKKRMSLEPTPANKPLLLFIIIVVISIIWSTIFRDPLVDPTLLSKKFTFVQVASGLTMIMLPGAFFLVANQINSIKTLQVMVIIILVAGAIALTRRLELLEQITFVNDNGLFTMWVVTSSIGLVFFQRNLAWWKQAILLVLAGGWIFFRFGLQISWLAGWLPLFVTLGVLSFMRSKKLVVIILLLVVIFIALNANYYLGTVLGNESDESGGTRMAAWEVNWRVTSKHLFLGTGPAGYAAYYMSYFPEDGMATHSNMIDILAQTGIFGLLFCMWFFVALAWWGYKLCRRLRGRGDFVEALANIAFAGTVGCIVMMIFGDWLFPFTYTQTIAGFDYIVYSWLFMGTIPVLYRLTQAEKAGVTAHA